jgi:hypothetical protein
MKPQDDAAERRKLPAFRLGGFSIAVDLPHLIFVTAMAGWCAWYWSDAYRASDDIENLSLIEPTAILALALYIFVLRDIISVRRVAAVQEPKLSPRKNIERSFLHRLLGTMALLAMYVGASLYVGFDITSFLYILLTLLFLGERRPLVLLLTPLIFCAVAIYCFNTILATPLPLTFFGVN